MNNVEEILLNNKEIIELVVDFLQENNFNVDKKINKLIKRITITDKILAKRLQESFQNSKYMNKNTFVRAIDDNSRPKSIDNSDLLQIENNLKSDTTPFIWQKNIKYLIENTVNEHKNKKKLLDQGLEPVKSILFHGAPGVGKTMAAKILAQELKLPIYILDLSTVMNSYLGKTGANLKKVFDYASEKECILLLDEFDAIGKQRTDESEIGELKRLVTVLIQVIDNWPASSILIAATNHPELLDRALWRRFDQVIEFQLPTYKEVEEIIHASFKNQQYDKSVMQIFIKSCIGLSHGQIKKEINKILKSILINNLHLEQVLCENLSNRLHSISREEKLFLSQILFTNNIMTQRKLSELLCLSRDSIRKISQK